MKNIRPLFTITVLVVVGAYLYVKINEGPSRPKAGLQGANQSDNGVPPLAAAGGGATLNQDSAAPAWPPVESKPAANAALAAPALPSANATASANAPSSAPGTKTGLPEVPPIPELPELPKAGAAVIADAQPPAAGLPAESPKNSPATQYGNDAGPNLGGAATLDSPGALPVLPALPPETANSGKTPATPADANVFPALPSVGNTAPASPAGAAGTNAVTPLQDDRYGTASAPAAATPPSQQSAPLSTTQSNPLRATVPAGTPTAQADDRYNLGASTALPAAQPIATTPPVAAAGESFAASWPAIQAALDRHDLKQAHQLLSKWHGNETLAPAEAQKVESLLGQLAGTVIYSNEHQLEPARVVKQGETLDSIAKEYNVPWQLLAKINGIPSPNQVQAGQSLKVVRGPFSAVVDLHRHELTLEVDGRYAGTFPVSVPPGATVEGQWLVDQKLAGAQSPVTPASYASAPAADRSIVLRNANANGALPGGQTLTIASNAPAAPGAATIRVAPQDAEDLSDILSVGSRVIVRR